MLGRLRSAITPPPAGGLAEAQRHLDSLTKPPGSLGRLEEIAARLAALAGGAPRVERPHIFTFAADHGVVAEGVSAYPQIVTVQMVENFLPGGAAGNGLPRPARAPGPGRAAGRGPGVDDAPRARRVGVVRRALAVNVPDARDGLDVLAKVGGFEIAGLVGVILAGAARRVPVVLDGFISGAAALVAVTLAPDARHALFASHRSAEPGHAVMLEHLGLTPYLDLALRLGEGTGAALFIHLARAAARIWREMATFKSAGVSQSEGASTAPSEAGGSAPERERTPENEVAPAKPAPERRWRPAGRPGSPGGRPRRARPR